MWFRLNDHIFQQILALLTYPVKRYVNCGFETVVKNGFHKAHLCLSSLNGLRYKMILAKQRYYCSSYKTTFGATTDLIKPNQTLSRNLKNQIMAFTWEGLNV